MAILSNLLLNFDLERATLHRDGQSGTRFENQVLFITTSILKYNNF